MASSPRVKSGRGDISMECYPYYVNMASDYTFVSPVMPCIAVTKAEKREWGRTCWEKHLVWVSPTNQTKLFSYTASGETTSSNIFWVDESRRCQNVCNTDWRIHEHAPSNFTIVFSHVPQTNSNTRLLPDIISQAIKRSGRIFLTMTPFIVKNLLLPLRPVMNKRVNLLLLIVTTLQSPAQEQHCFVANQESCWTSCWSFSRFPLLKARFSCCNHLKPLA